MGLVRDAALPEAPTALSYSATRTHCPLGMTRWQYATVAMHSGSIEGSPKAGPHICSSKTILHRLAWDVYGDASWNQSERTKFSGTLARDSVASSSYKDATHLVTLCFRLGRHPRRSHLQTMAPLRRYLRITKHSVLEVRIYLDRPADAEAWLLKRDNPALPRVIQAVRPLVLPKLREENERGKGKSGAKAKKKGVKDVVVEGEFVHASKEGR
jgi:hypothetical protein